MKLTSSILIKLLIVQYLSVLCLSQDFDFFYFVQQVSLVLLYQFNIVLFNLLLFPEPNMFFSFFSYSGQEHTVTQSTLVATLRQESLWQISAFMDFGLITKMDHTLPTVIQTVSLINLRYAFMCYLYLTID
jgi:hypothetical protein